METNEIEVIKIDKNNSEEYKERWEQFLVTFPQQNEIIFEHTFVSIASKPLQGHDIFSFIFLQQGNIIGLLPMYREKFLFLQRFVTPGLLSTMLTFKDAFSLIKKEFSLTAVYLAVFNRDFKRSNTTNDDEVAYTYLLDLKNKTADDIWKNDLEKDSRNLVRKAMKNGVTATITRSQEDLKLFYPLYVEKMKQFGSHPYPLDYFTTLLKYYRESYVVNVRYQQNIIAGALLIMYNKTCSNPYAASDSQFLHRAPNNFMYWECITFAVLKQCTLFDFGPSMPNNPVAKFKESMGGKPYLFEQLIILNKFWYQLFKLYKNLRV